MVYSHLLRLSFIIHVQSKFFRKDLSHLPHEMSVRVFRILAEAIAEASVCVRAEVHACGNHAFRKFLVRLARRPAALDSLALFDDVATELAVARWKNDLDDVQDVYAQA